VAPPGVPELNAHIRQRTKGGVGGLQPIAQNGINNLVGGCGVPLLPNKERLKGSAATFHCPEQLLTDRALAISFEGFMKKLIGSYPPPVRTVAIEGAIKQINC
jgi:hypothetical protein